MLPLERQRVLRLAICETVDDRRSVQGGAGENKVSGEQGVLFSDPVPPLARAHAIELVLVLAPTELEVSPTTLAFGACPVGGRQEMALTLRNTSPYPLLPAIEGLADGGAGGGDIGGFTLP